MDALKIIANLRWAHFSSRYLIPVYATLTVYGSLILSHAIREKNHYRSELLSYPWIDYVDECDIMQQEQEFGRYFNVGTCEITMWHPMRQ